jgi:hypothetical protein
LSIGRVIGFFQHLEAPIELGRLDRPDIGLDHLSQLHRLARGDRPLRRRGGHRRHRRREIGGTADRRHREFDGALAAGAENAFEAQPHRRRVAVERQFNGAPRQGLTLAREQKLCCAVDMVAAAARPARGVARLSSDKPPVLIAHHRFPWLCPTAIRHLQTPQKISLNKIHPPAGANARPYNEIMAILWLPLPQQSRWRLLPQRTA